MRGLNLRAIRQHVERLAEERRDGVANYDLVKILREGRRRAAAGEFVRMSPDEARQGGRDFRERMFAAGIIRGWS